MAYVNLGQVIYPIGAIFASTSLTSPSSMFGGTWSQITGDACLMAGTTVGSAGSKKITINQMPKHNHPLADDLGCGWQANSNTSDRLFYGRYTQARHISDFGHAAYQGGGARLLALLLQMLHVETHCLVKKTNSIEVMLHA